MIANNDFLLLQPLVNYNVPDGTYPHDSPTLTADWKADHGNQWTAPLGGGTDRARVRLMFPVGEL